MAFSLERENYVRSGLEGRAHGRGEQRDRVSQVFRCLFAFGMI